MVDNDISRNLKDVNQWVRIIYMVLFSVALYFATIVLYVMAVIQAVFAVVKGAPNKNLRDFGGALSAYIQQITSFLTYTHEDMPFPLADWPAYTAPEMEAADVEVSTAEKADTVKEAGVATSVAKGAKPVEKEEAEKAE
jgi:hypothetical protein